MEWKRVSVSVGLRGSLWSEGGGGGVSLSLSEGFERVSVEWRGSLWGGGEYLLALMGVSVSVHGVEGGFVSVFGVKGVSVGWRVVSVFVEWRGVFVCGMNGVSVCGVKEGGGGGGGSLSVSDCGVEEGGGGVSVEGGCLSGVEGGLCLGVEVVSVKLISFKLGNKQTTFD